MKAIRRFTVRVALPEPLAPLHGLMLNLRWSWHDPTADLFASIDPQAWKASGGDPIAMLSALSPDKIAALAADQEFLGRLHAAERDLREYMSGPRWYAGDGPEAPGAAGPGAIAYFSPEYGINAALPQYSGGLGILAGDHLKSASDLGVPLIGVGLLYRHGYFTQTLSADGWQAERYPAGDPNGLALALLRDSAGSPVHVAVGLTAGRRLSAQVWVAQVGRVPLLLLDSYAEENEADLHEVTDRLYGGGSEHRLRQELLLGIGGVRAVRAFCALRGHPAPEVFHTNEGHAGFLGLERIREYAEQGLSFTEAIEVCRAGTVFTTHTPVPAGIDRFDCALIRQHFADDPLLPVDQVLALGAETYPGGDPEVFNMAVMGMRLAQRVNGVSRLHGQVSREMFAGLWPGFDTSEVPIGSVTNGVHTPTWVAPEIRFLTAAAPAEQIWQTRQALRARLVAETRQRLRASWRQRGASGAELTWIEHVLDEHVLTIGFARRVPSYKRLTLMLNDAARLSQLMNDPERPLQVIVAGKAHPADDGGKALIQQMVQFSDSADVRCRIVFLPDYDMAMAHTLVQGCDVWLNNPLRPLEACGTSGMKAALNGGLNVSVRDGWWDEWYDGGNGWEIPSADGVTDTARRDELEAAALYELLAKSVTPMFYDRDPDGVPLGWVERIRHTLRSLGPKVQAERMVREYVSALYVPAVAASRSLTDDAGFGPARELAAWKQRVVRAWPQLRIEHMEAEAAGQHLGSALTVRVSVALGELSADDVTVEAVYGRPSDDDEIVQPGYATLTAEQGAAASGLVRYAGEVPLDRPGPFGYTVRVLPRHPLLSSRAELGLVTLPQAPAAMTNGDLRLERGPMMGEFVRLEVEDGIATIRLDRPPVNALNDQLRDELADAARSAGASDEIRAVILYGGEKVFAAGADIKEMSQVNYAAMTTRSGQLQATLSLIAGLPKPVVAAITGYALGGGLELALCADFRVAGESARLGQPEILLGVIPGAGGTQRLPRLVGPAKAKDIVFTGRMVKAAEAHAIGLVDLVAPDASVYQAARDMVQRYASGPALALRAAKEAIDHGLDVDLATGLEIERIEFAALFATEDQRSGMRSFIANGPGKATFTGR